MNKQTSFILQTREKESLSSDVLRVIDAITLDKKFPSRIVGSFQYKVFEYPGDIDIIEDFTGCCSVAQTAKKVATDIKSVAERIKTLKYAYLGDFKAGIDKRLIIDVGEWKLDSQDMLVLDGYSKIKIEKKLEELYDDGYISKDEYLERIKVLVETPDFKQHQQIYNLLYKMCIIRWSIGELVNGYKVLRKGKTITLEEALSYKSIVKIDVYSLSQGRFVEISNFYLIKSKTKDGQIIQISQNQGTDYIRQLNLDIVIFQKPELQKGMKLAKRLWLRAIYNKDEEQLLQLYPLFSSGTAKLSQILSDIETMQVMIDKLNNPPLRIMTRSLQEIKMRLGTISATDVPPAKMVKILKVIDTIKSDLSSEKFNQKLQKIYDLMTSIVHSNSIRYLKKRNIL
jgi:hypothetical protein